MTGRRSKKKDDHVYVFAVYEEYDNCAHTLVKKILRGYFAVADSPPTLCINLPSNKVEQELGISKCLTIKPSELGYPIKKGWKDSDWKEPCDDCSPEMHK